MPARVGNITFDCDDVLRMAAYWSAALGRPVDKGSSKLFASIGGADALRAEPAWYFNKVPEGKRARTAFTSIWWTPIRQPSTSSYGMAPRSSVTTRSNEEPIPGP